MRFGLNRYEGNERWLSRVWVTGELPTLISERACVFEKSDDSATTTRSTFLGLSTDRSP